MRTNLLILSKILAACTLTGCASGQLNYNTEDLAGTVDKLIKDQIVANIVRFVQDPNTIPAQVAIPAGSVTTVNQVSASWADPLSKALTATQTLIKSAAPSLTGTSTSVLASSTLTPSVNNQASQNWSLSTISVAEPLRRIRALYRYITNAPNSDICREYPLPVTSYPTSGSSALLI